MNLELLVKMVDDFTNEELDELREEANAMKVSLEDFDEQAYWNEKRKWVYMPVVFSINQIIPFSKYDTNHCMIGYASQDPIVVKIKFNHLKAIYSQITGELIRSEADFRFEKATK